MNKLKQEDIKKIRGLLKKVLLKATNEDLIEVRNHLVDADKELSPAEIWLHNDEIRNIKRYGD